MNRFLHHEERELEGRLGGDSVATRAANALRRNGVTDLSELSSILDTDGVEHLEADLLSMRGMGQGLADRVLRTLGVQTGAKKHNVFEIKDRVDYPKEIRERSCATCNAGPGESCWSRNGFAAALPHAARRDAAFPVLSELGNEYLASLARGVLLRHKVTELKDLEPVLLEEGIKGLRYHLLDMRGMGELSAEHVIQVIIKQCEITRPEHMDVDA